MVTQSMNPHQYLANYASGWSKGDVEEILGATAPAYQFDDPQAGRITRDEFRTYFQTIRSLRSAQPFMELTDVVVEDRDTELLAWCWWKIPGAAQGSGFIRVGPEGVTSEKIAYYQ